MDIYVFFRYFLSFMLYSFIGWSMEVILTFIDKKKFVDRGFLIGPYCPIYGYGMMLIVFLLRNYTSNVLVLFILAKYYVPLAEHYAALKRKELRVIFQCQWVSKTTI